MSPMQAISGKARDMSGEKTSVAKWGAEAIAAGFTVVPNHLISINQFVDEEKQLSPTEMLVILQILVVWWSKDRAPFPSKATIAQRAGLSPRQVQRALTSLEKKTYIQRITRFSTNRARTSNEYNLQGLTSIIAEAAKAHPHAFKGKAASETKSNTDGEL